MTRFLKRFHSIILLAAAGVLSVGTHATAGPVPGVETFDKKPVTFPVPPSITAWDIGNDEYLVTFHWKIDQPNPGVAGDFNNWNRKDLPMSGPDANGVWSVTARLKAGEYQYKLVSGDNGWQTDELNPERGADGHDNAILRLGIAAEIKGKTGKRGDGEIEMRAVTHDPQDYHYVDVVSPNLVIFRVRTLANDVNQVSLHPGGLWSPLKLVAHDAQFDYWEASVWASSWRDPLAYTFTLTDGTKTETVGPFSASIKEAKSFHAPEWAKSAIWYQIVVDRFRDGEPTNNPEHTLGTGRVKTTFPWKADFFSIPGSAENPSMAEFFKHDGDGDNYPDIWQRLYGGDFQGVIDKLAYLRSLGVNAIYFNPIFESTSGHKYNAKSYQFADDGYGFAGEFAKSVASSSVFDVKTWKNNESDKKFFELLREAHKRKMHVIIDGVFNHLGDSSPYFIDVKKNGKKSPYADWWDIDSWDPVTYHGWAGAGELPQFRKDQVHGIASDSARKFIFDCTKKWMDPNGDGDPSDGIDGWRLDVPMDVPMPFWDEWCAYVRKINPNAYIVGEVWSPAEEWMDGKKFDAVMNYQFRVAALRFFGNKKERIKASDFDNELARLRIRYPAANTAVMQNLLDSHDTDRIASRLYNPDRTKDHLFDGENRVQDKDSTYNAGRPTDDVYQRLKLLALFQTTYIGAPMIYYGTEVGMYGADDPMCRNPMWWQDMMPYDNPDDRIDKDLFTEYQSLLKLRGEEKCLNEGQFETVLADDSQVVYAFRRFMPGKNRSVVVVLNNSDSYERVALPLRFAGAKADVKQLHGAAVDGKWGDDGQYNILLQAASGAVFAVTSSDLHDVRF